MIQNSPRNQTVPCPDCLVLHFKLAQLQKNQKIKVHGYKTTRMKARIGKALSNHENDEKIFMIFGMLKHDLNLPEFRYVSIFPSFE